MVTFYYITGARKGSILQDFKQFVQRIWYIRTTTRKDSYVIESPSRSLLRSHHRTSRITSSQVCLLQFFFWFTNGNDSSLSFFLFELNHDDGTENNRSEPCGWYRSRGRRPRLFSPGAPPPSAGVRSLITCSSRTFTAAWGAIHHTTQHADKIQHSRDRIDNPESQKKKKITFSRNIYR